MKDQDTKSNVSALPPLILGSCINAFTSLDLSFLFCEMGTGKTCPSLGREDSVRSRQKMQITTKNAGLWPDNPTLAASPLCHQNPLLLTASQVQFFSPGDLQFNSWKHQGFAIVTVEFQASAGRRTGPFLEAECVAGTQRKTH